MDQTPPPYEAHQYILARTSTGGLRWCVSALVPSLGTKRYMYTYRYSDSSIQEGCVPRLVSAGVSGNRLLPQTYCMTIYSEKHYAQIKRNDNSYEPINDRI